MSKRILVIAPHNDDETLGAGASIAKHVANGDDVTIAILTSIGEDHPVMKPNKSEIRAETKLAMSILGVPEEKIIFKDLPNVLVPDQPVHSVNKVVYEVIKDIEPEIIYMPFLVDLHKDHREIAYATQVAARTCTDFGKKIQEVLMYETLSETHWNIECVEGGFIPNVYNDVSDFLDLKLRAIEAYQSQLKTHPDVRSVKAIESLAILRGSIVGMKAAEAFVLVRNLR